MLKIAVAGIAVVAVAFFVLQGRGDAGVGKVTSCLEKAGARVVQTTALEDFFASDAAQHGETMPEPFMNVVREVQKYLYEAHFGDATAMLIFARSGQKAEQLEADSVELGVPFSTVPPQRFDNVVVLWPKGPSAVASAAVSDCLS